MNKYLERHAYLGKQIELPPRSDLQFIVVIPVYGEEDLVTTLHSLCHCEAPNGSVECIVVINAPINADGKILSLNQEVLKLVESLQKSIPKWFCVLVVVQNQLPIKKAGVGLARKIGMDEAVRRFDMLGRDGLIINIDADCTCSPNYFRAIQTYFDSHPQVWSGCVDFNHLIEPLQGQDRSAITDYELHLRYFIGAQRAVGLPFAYQTVGSCMVVRCLAYQKRGGMNTRKAGEDFYFIHKFVSISRHGDIPDAKVYPSARASTRVPFGTGRAIAHYGQTGIQLTSAWQSFLDLQSLVDDLEALAKHPEEIIRNWPTTLQSYFLQIEGVEQVIKLVAETSSYATFKQRFYQWFDAFQLMKYVHFCRKYYPDQPILAQARMLSVHLKAGKEVSQLDSEGLLDWFRQSEWSL